MRINTNVSALNSQRILGQTGASVAKNIQRLSSGFRINKAADDAAGLGIANKMRADIRGMKQATRNAEQANSLLQVAEGATQTIAGILDRMKELAVQSASDTVNGDSRALIQAEFSELQSEITRITDTTKFQGSKLLTGAFGNYADLAAGGTTIDTAAGFSGVRAGGAKAATYTFTQTAGAVTVAGNAKSQTITAVAGGAQTLNFDVHGISVDTHANFAIGAGSENLTGALVVAGGNTSFMVSVSGEEGGAAKDFIGLGSLDLTLATLGVDTDTLASKSGATTAVTNIDLAIKTVNTAFGTIGAAQNRVDYATQNVKTATENYAAAESTIRDVDMAAEMTEFSKNQILQQAGVSMLAQANSSAQNILKLLG